MARISNSGALSDNWRSLCKTRLADAGSCLCLLLGNRIWLLSCLLTVVYPGSWEASIAAADDVRFSRDVLPILSDRCFHCHGPDASHREAELRLDVEEDALADRDGNPVIVSGDPDASELLARIITDDPDLRMPPVDSGRKELTAREIAILTQWIREGAVWGKHWSFEKPVRLDLPGGKGHPVDAFVRRRLAEAGMTPSPEASRHTLLRRVSFDLTGLPPTPEEIAAFMADKSPNAFEKVVDRLLESPHYGERMAMWWLDAARYSDTDGYQGDANRTNWAWRDWVVDSFNQNKPFNEFTIEQFAGDLLPDATPQQILATCFHRNHMTNGEGGRDPEESRIDYVRDRANTTGTVWLGLTLGCCQCHSHKFDPVSQKDYYQLTAFFNSIDEDGKAGRGAKPYLKYRSPYAQRAVKEMEAFIAEVRPQEAAGKTAAGERFGKWLGDTIRNLPHDYRAWRPLTPVAVTSAEGTDFRVDPDGIVQAIGDHPRQDDYRVTFAAPAAVKRVTGWKLDVLTHSSHTDCKLSRGKKGEFVLTNVKLLVRKKGAPQVRDIEMRGAVADYERSAKGRAYGKVRDTLDDDPRNGWTTETGDAGKPHQAVFELREPLTVASDEELVFVLLHRSTLGDANIGRFRISVTDEAGETVRSLKTSALQEVAAAQPDSAEAVPDALRKRLLSQFLLDDAEYQTVLERLNEANRQLSELKRASGELGVMVLAERKEPRDSHVLVRGVWDAKGEKVQPGMLPAVLGWSKENAQSRLDLAEWIVSGDNPLTARVVVNHLWQIMFGAGLVRTPDDFGLQGERPTHPDLLDWLAVELVAHNWDIRHILKLIATSQTYRQSSVISPELQEADPENRLLARAPRFRLAAWMIRDAALKSSGLLNPATGGPPVNPWQPDGVWREIFMGRFTYRPSLGPAQYRRTLYAFWRRSSAPTFLFDSAQRRVCEVGQRRTNTPLHALTLLNDASMLEASRALADLVMLSSGTTELRLNLLAARVLGRDLDGVELSALDERRKRALGYFKEHSDDAVSFSTVGQIDAPAEAIAPDTAAWMTVASLLLNLDEAISHE